MGEDRLDIEDLKRIMQDDPEAVKKLESSKRKESIAKLMGGVGDLHFPSREEILYVFTARPLSGKKRQGDVSSATSYQEGAIFERSGTLEPARVDPA